MVLLNERPRPMMLTTRWGSFLGDGFLDGYVHVYAVFCTGPSDSTRAAF
jgi:hypothetical protein